MKTEQHSRMADMMAMKMVLVGGRPGRPERPGEIYRESRDLPE